MSYPSSVKPHQIFVAVFVALQMILPATYYTLREDKNDERFAWRMFISIQICQVAFKVDGKPVRTHSTFHEAWIRIGQFGRRAIISKMAERLCKDHPAQEVRVEATCRRVTGEEEEIFSGRRNFCQVRRL